MLGAGNASWTWVYISVQSLRRRVSLGTLAHRLSATPALLSRSLRPRCLLKPCSWAGLARSSLVPAPPQLPRYHPRPRADKPAQGWRRLTAELLQPSRTSAKAVQFLLSCIGIILVLVRTSLRTPRAADGKKHERVLHGLRGGGRIGGCDAVLSSDMQLSQSKQAEAQSMFVRSRFWRRKMDDFMGIQTVRIKMLLLSLRRLSCAQAVARLLPWSRSNRQWSSVSFALRMLAQRAVHVHGRSSFGS